MGTWSFAVRQKIMAECLRESKASYIIENRKQSQRPRVQDTPSVTYFPYVPHPKSIQQ